MRKVIGALCAGVFLLSLQGWGEATDTKSLKAIIEMDAGKITIELYEKDAPGRGESMQFKRSRLALVRSEGPRTECSARGGPGNAHLAQ